MMREEKQKILDMVANGSITPEEAIMLLECLEGSNPEESSNTSAGEAPPISIHADAQAAQQAAGPAPDEKNDVKDKSPDPTPEPTVKVNAPTPPPEPTAYQSHPYAPPVPPKAEPSYTAPPQPAYSPDFPWENEPEPPQNSYRYSYTVSDSAIQNLKISWINGPIVVKAYDGADIQVTEYCRQELTGQDILSITVVNSMLQIKWDSGDRLLSFARMIGKSFLTKHLIVEVPQAIANQLGDLDCTSISGGLYCSQFSATRTKLSTTSGKIHAAGIVAQNLKLSSVSGSVHLFNCSAETMTASSTSGAVFSEGFSANIAGFDTVSGRITTSGNASHFKANTVSGKILSQLHAMPGRIKMDSISGRIMLTIPENEGFTVKYSSLSGILQSDFPLTGNLGMKNGQASYGNGSTEVNLSTLSGRMQIHKGN